MDLVNGAHTDPDLGPDDWSRRYKQNLERIETGDRTRIAEVVRQLSDRQRITGISAGEKRMLARARRLLDDQGNGTAGVREPRRPSPSDDAVRREVPGGLESIS